MTALMGERDGRPAISGGEDVVIDPDPRADDPPRAGEGKVTLVEFDHAYTSARENLFRRCQICPETFSYSAPHVRVTIDLAGDPTLGGSRVTSMLCSRDCWFEWATSDG